MGRFDSRKMKMIINDDDYPFLILMQVYQLHLFIDELELGKAR